MDRRRFLLTSLAGGLAAPLAAGAQQARAIPVVGILHDRPGGKSAIIEGLQGALRKLGYVDGQTVNFEIRFAGGRREDLAGLARDLVQRKVDVVFAVGPAALSAAKDAMGTIPIVGIALEIDPVAAGYARSVAQPGGNVTGLFLDQPALAGKWLQLIREVVPGISRIALLRDPTTGPWQLAAAMAIGKDLGMELQVLEAQYATDSTRYSGLWRKRDPERSCSSHHRQLISTLDESPS
jgi:putative ABC transport system substrate-binding protein